MNLEEKLYTSTEVAQILGVSLRSVYRYLEEGKLDAEVKTATGRHRFTKQNILDFLYPKDGSAPAVAKVEPAPFRANSYQSMPEPVREPVKPVVKEEPEEEEVDWLAKFREAARKFREEEQQVPVKEVQRQTFEEEVVRTPFREPVREPVRETPRDADTFSLNDLRSSFRQTTTVEETYSKPVMPSKEFHYYRSMLGGLKDIAQNIDRSARKASVEYAFTRNAGLSLHKPIRPFSLLHAYVKPMDKDFFERSLHLVPSDETNAQLCLITTSEPEVFLTRRELHNLYVVSNNQLKKDLQDAGEDDLVGELETVM